MEFHEQGDNELAAEDDSHEPELDQPEESTETAGYEDVESMSLVAILAEIGAIMQQVNAGEPYDNNRLELLIKMQEENLEFKQQIEEENERWRDEINSYCAECLDVMRSFVPPNIFSSTLETLLDLHLPEDIAKRILYKPCLWLTRMSTDEIARLHIADLQARYDVNSQNLDVVETAAVYYSLPDRFLNDNTGRKIEWRESVERELKILIEDKDADCLVKHKLRHPAYTGLKRGPVMDLSSVKEFEVVKGESSNKGPRKSFQEVCSKHSLAGKMREDKDAQAARAALQESA
jgi:hypothetical protein